MDDRIAGIPRRIHLAAAQAFWISGGTIQFWNPSIPSCRTFRWDKNEKTEWRGVVSICEAQDCRFFGERHPPFSQVNSFAR